MHSAEAKGKGDISTLPGRGHFYFALTDQIMGCRGKIEMSYLSKVEMSYCPHEKAAIPSINIVLHRGQPSRLPSGAKAGGLDGARPRRDKNSWEEGMAGRGLAEVSQNRTFLLCWE